MLDWFVLWMYIMNAICKLFPYTFKFKATTGYFCLQPQSITSWDKFERLLFAEYGDDNFPSTLVMVISRVKMENKVNVEDFNQWFVTLLNRILIASWPPGEVLIDFYTSTLLMAIAMFIKRMGRTTFLETFNESLKVEKYLLSLKGNLGEKGLDDHIFLREQNNHVQHKL